MVISEGGTGSDYNTTGAGCVVQRGLGARSPGGSAIVVREAPGATYSYTVDRPVVYTTNDRIVHSVERPVYSGQALPGNDKSEPLVGMQTSCIRLCLTSLSPCGTPFYPPTRPISMAPLNLPNSPQHA